MGVPYTFEYDNNLKDKGSFDRVPLSFYRKGLRPSAVTVAAKVFTFTGAETAQNCRLTYQYLKDEYGFCQQTIADALGTLREMGEIERVRRDMKGTEYRFAGRNSARYDVIPRLLRYGTIKDKDGIRRKLFTSEIRVLANIMTECSDKKNGGNGKNGGGTYRASFKQMAYVLNLSETTVQNAIHNLIAAGIVVKHEKGINRFKNSAYRVRTRIYNEYLRHQKQKEPRLSPETPQKAIEKNVRDVNARLSWKRYYEVRAEELEKRVEKYMFPVMQDKEYKETQRNLRSVSLALVRAQLENSDNIMALTAEKTRLLVKRRKLFERFGLEIALPFWEEDVISEKLKRVFARCKECGDTGTRPSGIPCTCYQKGDEL